MIIDEQQIGLRFMNDLLRACKGKENTLLNGATDIPDGNTFMDEGFSFENEINEILLEIELLEADFGEADCSYAGPSMESEPFVAFSRKPMTDSRKKWRITRFVAGCGNS